MLKLFLACKTTQKQVESWAWCTGCKVPSPGLAYSCGHGGEEIGMGLEFMGRQSSQHIGLRVHDKWGKKRRKEACPLDFDLTHWQTSLPWCWGHVTLLPWLTPFSGSSLCKRPSHLALCFKTSRPGTTSFFNLAPDCCPSHTLPSKKDCFPVCKLLFTDPKCASSMSKCPLSCTGHTKCQLFPRGSSGSPSREERSRCPSVSISRNALLSPYLYFRC